MNVLGKAQRFKLKNTLFLKGVVGAVFTLLLASKADACGFCMHVITEFNMPDSLKLTKIILLWFLCLSYLLTRFKKKVRYLPSASWSVVIVVIGIFLASSFTGSMPLNLLAVFCIIGSIQVFFMREKSSQINRLKGLFRLVNGMALILIVLFFSHSNELKKNMTRVDHILKWEHSGPARSEFQRMLDKGEAHLPDFRKVAENGTSDLLEIAAKGLEKYGDPEKDVPLLIHALSVCQQAEYCDVFKVRKSLIKLSGRDDLSLLGKDVSPLEWDKAWEHNKENVMETTTM